MSSQEEKEKEDLKSLIINYRKESMGLNGFLLNLTPFNRSQIAKNIEEYERKSGIGINRTEKEKTQREERLKQLLAKIYPPLPLIQGNQGFPLTLPIMKGRGWGERSSPI